MPPHADMIRSQQRAGASTSKACCISMAQRQCVVPSSSHSVPAPMPHVQLSGGARAPGMAAVPGVSWQPASLVRHAAAAWRCSCMQRSGTFPPGISCATRATQAGPTPATTSAQRGMNHIRKERQSRALRSVVVHASSSSCSSSNPAPSSSGMPQGTNPSSDQLSATHPPSQPQPSAPIPVSELASQRSKGEGNGQEEVEEEASSSGHKQDPGDLLERCKAATRAIRAADTWQELRATFRVIPRELLNPLHISAVLVRLRTLLGATSRYHQEPGLVDVASGPSSASQPVVPTPEEQVNQGPARRIAKNEPGQLLWAGPGGTGSAAGTVETAGRTDVTRPVPPAQWATQWSSGSGSSSSTPSSNGAQQGAGTMHSLPPATPHPAGTADSTASTSSSQQARMFPAAEQAAQRSSVAVVTRAGMVQRRASAAAKAAAKAREKKELATFISAVLIASEPLLPQFTMRELSNVLHSLARMRQRPPGPWTLSALERARETLPSATAQQLGSVVWSLGKLGLDPGPQWLDAACATSAALMAHHQMLEAQRSRPQSQPLQPERPQPVGMQGAGRWQSTEHWIVLLAQVNVAWGLARLKHNVPPAWANAFLTMIGQEWSHWQSTDAHTLSNTVWALVTLGVDPPSREWQQGFLAAAARVLPSATSWELSMILWALSSWHCMPNEQWMGRFLSAAANRMPSAEPAHVARLMYSLAQLGFRPPPWWMARVLQQTVVQAFEFNGQAFSNLLWAVAKLRRDAGPNANRMPGLTKEWLETLLVAIYEQGMDGFGPQELSNTLWALGRLGHIPDTAWLDLFWSEAYCQLPDFTSQQLVNTLWAAVKLGQAPEDQWMDEFLKVSGRRRVMDTFTPQGFANLISCMAELELVPPPPWLRAFFRASLPALRAARLGQDVGDGTEGQAGSTSATGSSTAAAAYLADYGTSGTQGLGAATAAEGQADGSAACDPAAGLVYDKLAVGLAKLRVRPPAEWIVAFLGETHAAMAHMRGSNLARLAYGVAMLNLNPSRSWVVSLVEAADVQLQTSDQVDRVTLGQLLWAVRRLGGPGEAAFQKWRDRDWIGAALELYGEDN